MHCDFIYGTVYTDFWFIHEIHKDDCICVILPFITWSLYMQVVMKMFKLPLPFFVSWIFVTKYFLNQHLWKWKIGLKSTVIICHAPRNIWKNMSMCIYCNVLQIIVFTFVLFLPVIVLSVLLRFTVDDYPFGIFKLF